MASLKPFIPMTNPTTIQPAAATRIVQPSHLEYTELSRIATPKNAKDSQLTMSVMLLSPSRTPAGYTDHQREEAQRNNDMDDLPASPVARRPPARRHRHVAICPRVTG